MAAIRDNQTQTANPMIDLGTINVIADLLKKRDGNNGQQSSTSSSQPKKQNDQNGLSGEATPSDDPAKYLNSVIIAAVAPMVAQHATEAYMQTGQVPDASSVLTPLLQSKTGQEQPQAQQQPQEPSGKVLMPQSLFTKQKWDQGTNTLQMGGLFDFTGQTLSNIEKAQKITGKEPLQPKDKAKQDALDPMKSIEAMTKLNSIIEEKLPGYQTTQTADGSIVIHPKPSGVLAQMSPEQMDMMATNLVSGNVVPSQLPRIQKNQVLSAAMAKDPYYNPAKSDIDFAVNKVGASNFEKLYNNVTSFEKTFRKNADVALKLSEGFDRSKIPLLNKAIMAGKLHIEGDPQASKLLVSLYTVATEYARLTSAPGATGSMITDSAREEARSMLNHYMNKGTIKELLDPEIGIMSIDAQNRIDALNETKSEIQNKISGRKGNNASSPTPQNVPKVGETFNGEKVLKVRRIK